MRINQITPTATAVNMSRCELLISYHTPVAVKIYTELEVDNFKIPAGTYRTEKDWSVTTSGHITRWAGFKVTEKLPQEIFDKISASISVR